MLEVRAANKIKDAINSYANKENRYLYVSLDDVYRMQMIPVSAEGGNFSHTILSLQKEKTTILVRILFIEETGVEVQDIYFKKWEKKQE